MEKSSKPTKESVFQTMDEHFKENYGHGLLEIIEHRCSADDSVHKALGISDERMKVLGKIGEKAWEETETTSDNLIAISKHCQNVNELAFMCFQMGINVEKSITSTRTLT